MAGVDPVPRDLGAGKRDVGVALAVEPLTGFHPWSEQAEVLELARELGRDPGPPAELGHLDLLLLPTQARGPTLDAVGRRSPKLLPDHAQRQELVALKAQDRHEALDVGLGEEAVAA